VLGWCPAARDGFDYQDRADYLARPDPEQEGCRRQHRSRVRAAEDPEYSRALGSDPPIVPMDEPLGAVEPVTRHNLRQELLQIQAEIRKTIVFVTHDIDEALSHVRRVPGHRLARPPWTDGALLGHVPSDLLGPSGTDCRLHVFLLLGRRQDRWQAERLDP
jgi:hypothetical protein